MCFQSEHKVSQFLLPVWAPLLMLDNLVTAPMQNFTNCTTAEESFTCHKMKELDPSKEIYKLLMKILRDS